MLNFGFFNSTEGTTDRVYTAADFNKCFDAIASDGIFRRFGGALTVGYNTGMSVQVLDGFARFGGYWVYNDAFVNLDIATADTQYTRIDAVVIRVDVSARTIELIVKKGTAAATPAAPEMTRGDTVNEYCLCTITIPANTTRITQDIITDTRGVPDVCGWVKCGALVRYTSQTTLSAATTTMSINIPEYEKGDLLDVYRSGIHMLESVDYTNNNDGTITFPSALSAGDMSFVVTKITY